MADLSRLEYWIHRYEGGTDACGGKAGDNSLDAFFEPDRDAFAASYAERREAGGAALDQLLEFGVGDLPRSVHQRHGIRRACGAVGN